MLLTWPIVLAVLFGALLHASWNALVKSSSDKALDTALIHLIGSVIAIPLLVIVGLPPANSWPFIAASVVIHIAYYIALTGAYQYGDLGLTYPLMRGSAPLLVALSSVFFIGEVLTSVAWAGILAVSCGIIALGFSKQALESPRAVVFALSNAVIIAIYTIVDAKGARASGNALQYVAALFVVDGWPFAILVFMRRGKLAIPYAVKRWPVALGAAIASLASYGIALWAMTQAPIAMVAALRETSVLFAALLGFWVLKESFNLCRGLGIGIILIGVLLIRIA